MATPREQFQGLLPHLFHFDLADFTGTTPKSKPVRTLEGDVALFDRTT
jgi:hypothetical protein